MDISFETLVKERLKWKVEQWLMEKEELKGMRQLINSMKYWNVKLSNAKRCNNVIFTLFNNDERAYPSLSKVDEELSNLNNLIEIKGYAKFRNRRYLSISFLNEETRDFVLQNLRVIDNKKVAFLNWIDDTEQNFITVHWLSDETDLLSVAEFFESYIDIKSMQREKTILEGGKEYTSGKVIITGNLKANINIEDVPHSAIIDGLECLITIEGRAYKCLVCQAVGHKASQCKKGFCAVCRRIMFKDHVCGDSRRTDMIMFGAKENWHLEQQNDRIAITPQAVQNEDTQNDNYDNLNNLFYLNKLQFNGKSGNCEHLDSSTQLSLQISENMDSSQKITGIQVKDKKVDTNGFPGTSSINDWFRIDNNVNPYIRDEATLGQTNFIIADTETDESDTSDTMSVSQWEQFQQSMLDLNKGVELSRSLLKDALVVTEPMEVDKTEKTTKTENQISLNVLGMNLSNSGDGREMEGAAKFQDSLSNSGTSEMKVIKKKKKKRFR